MGLKRYYIYLDDTRSLPSLFDIVVKSYDEFVDLVRMRGSGISDSFISFDHDLGEGKNGYDCAKFLVEWCIEHGYEVPQYDIHSANPVGRKNIESIFETYKKIYGKVDDTISQG